MLWYFFGEERGAIDAVTTHGDVYFWLSNYTGYVEELRFAQALIDPSFDGLSALVGRISFFFANFWSFETLTPLLSFLSLFFLVDLGRLLLELQLLLFHLPQLFQSLFQLFLLLVEAARVEVVQAHFIPYSLQIIEPCMQLVYPEER